MWWLYFLIHEFRMHSFTIFSLMWIVFLGNLRLVKLYFLRASRFNATPFSPQNCFDATHGSLSLMVWDNGSVHILFCRFLQVSYSWMFWHSGVKWAVYSCFCPYRKFLIINKVNSDIGSNILCACPESISNCENWAE